MPNTKDFQLYGKVVDRHGQPLAGVGMALLKTDLTVSKPADATSVVATTVTDSNGLFVMEVVFPISLDKLKFELKASTSKKLVHLDEFANSNINLVVPGRLYGPLTIVVDQDREVPAKAVTHRSALLASEEEILTAIKRAPGLFFKASPARKPDPCSPYSPPGIPSRIARYSGTVRFSISKEAPVEHHNLPQGKSSNYSWGYLSELEQSWYELGLGLGGLLYSVPLAPCEETKFAIVDWRRKDWARRSSAVDESHYQETTVTRDQAVDEVVNMTSKKYGEATTGAFGYGFSIGPLSLGGGSSSSTGEENITSNVNAHRTVNDRTRMASQTIRGTRAFSIVETTQEEESVVRTRVLRNHNHCHTITFQYFEVLQHYLISTRERRRRPVLFVRFAPWTFTIEEVAKSAYLLRKGLLDPTLEPALDKFMGIVVAKPTEQSAIDGNSSSQQRTVVKKIFVSIAAGALGTNPVTRMPEFDLHLLIDGNECNSIGGIVTNMPATIEFEKQVSGVSLPALEDIKRISIKNISEAAYLDDIVVEAETQPPGSAALVNVELVYWEHIDLGKNRVASKQIKPTVVQSVQDAIVETASDFQIRRLLQHLNSNRFHYSAVIWAGADPGERMTLLEPLSIGGVPILDLIENVVAGVDGFYCAYPLRDPLLLPQEYWGVEGQTDEEKKKLYLQILENPSITLDERLIVLPTPGVFAESQLGSCNACEKIDDTRFWDWQKSPCPDQAPDITAEMLGSRYQAPTGLEFVKPELTPEKMVFPELPKPMIEIGDATLSNLTKGLDLQDPKAVMEFVGGLVQSASENYRHTLDTIMKYLNEDSSKPSGGPGSGAAIKSDGGDATPSGNNTVAGSEGSLPPSGVASN